MFRITDSSKSMDQNFEFSYIILAFEAPLVSHLLLTMASQIVYTIVQLNTENI